MVNVYNVEVYKNELCPNGCIRLFWEGDKGWGQYDLVVRSHSDEEFAPADYKLEIIGDSEYMDDNDDKSFLKHLLESLVNQIDVVG